VKNLCRAATPEILKRRFSEYGQLTDVKIATTKDGVSRRFAFLGYASEDSATRARKGVHNTYIMTNKVQVDFAREIGSKEIPRGWSKYTEGTSAFQKRVQKDAAKVETTKKGKAGKVDKADAKTAREEKQRLKEVLKRKKEEAALEAGLDDMAFLKAKVSTDADGEDDGDQGHAAEEEAHEGRVLLQNVPFASSEGDVKALAENHGPVVEVHLPTDEDTSQSRGFVFVTFAFLKDAEKAAAAMDGTIFQGRLLKVRLADKKPEREEPINKKKLKGYKKEKIEKLKKLAKNERSWNLLFTSANASAEAMAKGLGIDKRDLLAKDAEGLGIRLALGETHVVQETKKWLEKEGIALEAFDQAGDDLLTSTFGEKARRDDTIIVKHLPAGASADELAQRFAKFGAIIRFSMAPSGTLAIVQFAESRHAQAAFKGNAFRRFHRIPMMLEWAPDNVFTSAAAPAKPLESVSTKVVQADDEPDQDPAKIGAKVIIRNVAFEANSKELRQFLSVYGQIAAMRIPKKPGAAQHRGFAFVDFVTAGDARSTMEQLKHTHFYARRLKMEPAEDTLGTAADARASLRRQLENRETVSASRRKKQKINEG